MLNQNMRNKSVIFMMERKFVNIYHVGKMLHQKGNVNACFGDVSRKMLMIDWIKACCLATDN